MYARQASVDMDISMDIHGKSVDMDMDGKFHIHGKPDLHGSNLQYHYDAGQLPQIQGHVTQLVRAGKKNSEKIKHLYAVLCIIRKRWAQFNSLQSTSNSDSFRIGSNFTSFVISRSPVEGGPKKQHKVYGSIILQPCITESCGFQQNVLKEILYMTKVIV